MMWERIYVVISYCRGRTKSVIKASVVGLLTEKCFLVVIFLLIGTLALSSSSSFFFF